MDTKLLIVDDDHNICDMLKLYFENEGYKVKVANDGFEGLNTFKVYDFHNTGGDIAITYPATGNMRIDVKCAITVEEGYEIADVLVDGVSVGAVEEYLFRGINKNHKIEAVFAPIAE